MAENIDISINATDNASPALTRINNNLTTMQRNVAATSNVLNTFRNVLLGLGAVGFVTSTIAWADSLQDLSDATGIATEQILGLSKAIQQNGGNFEDAQRSIAIFVENIGEAKNGAEKTIESFQKVGVTLYDLRRLSEQDILAKTIQGLSKIGDVALRAKLQTELLGRGLRGVNILGVAEDFNAAVEESKQYSESIRRSAEIQDKLDQSITKLREAITPLLAVLADFAQMIMNNIETVKNFVKVIAVVVAAFVSMTVIGRIGSAIIAVLTRMGAVIEGLQYFVLYLGARFGGLGRILATVTDKLIEWSIKLYELGQRIPGISDILAVMTTIISGITGVVVGGITAWKLWGNSAEDSAKQANDAVDALSKKTFDYHRQLRELRNTPIVSGEVVTAPEGHASVAEYFKKEREKRKAAAEEAKRQAQQAAEQIANQIRQIQDLTDSYKRQNDEIVASINNEIRYAQVSEDTAEILRLQNDIKSNSLNLIYDLQKQRVGAEAAVVAEIDRQIVAIKQSITIDQQRAGNALRNLQQMRNAQAELYKVIEDTNRLLTKNEAMAQLQEELSLIGLYGNELEKQNQLMSINRDLRQQMAALSVQLLNLEIQRISLGEEAYNKERARIVQQMYDAQELANARTEAIQEEFQRRSEIEQSYAEGIRNSMRDIAESFKPVNMAQEAITKGWDRIGSAIDEMVETGKTSFSDLARSIINDITKMILKMLVFKAIEAGLNAVFPGLGTAVTAIGGRANGGPVNKNTPYMVGERGPELFIPQNSGKIVSNNDLKNNSDSTRQTPTNNIYNNYYINALDAKSVAQLFAENRKAIFGANKMAEREMSYAGVR